MSDSDCSNCDVKKCRFRYYSYSCYKNQIKEVRQHMSKADLDLFQRVFARCEELKEVCDNDAFFQIAGYVRQIVDMYNGK